MKRDSPGMLLRCSRNSCCLLSAGNAVLQMQQSRLCPVQLNFPFSYWNWELFPEGLVWFRHELCEHLFSAISSMIKEALDSKANLRLIDDESQKILFTNLKNHEGTFVLISSKVTHYFYKSIENFINEIPMQLINKTKNVVNTTKVKPEFDTLITATFPYLRIHE